MSITPSVDFLKYLEGVTGGDIANLDADPPLQYDSVHGILSIDSAAQGSSGVVSSFQQSFSGEKTFVDPVRISSSENAINATSGALIIQGGLNIRKDTLIEGSLDITGQMKSVNLFSTSYTEQATDTQTGALQIAGGGSFGKDVYAANMYANKFFGNFQGSTYVVLSTENSTSINTGSLKTAGGIALEKDLHVGGSINIDSITSQNIYMNNTNNSKFVDISSTNGELTIYSSEISPLHTINGKISIKDTTNSNDLSSGSMIVDGGIGCAKNINIGANCRIYSTTDADTNTYTAYAMKVDGGLIAGSAIAGIHGFNLMGGTNVMRTYDPDNPRQNLSLQYLSAAKAANFRVDANGNLNISTFPTTASVIITNTVESNDTSNGSIITSGGIGIAKNVNIGGNLRIYSTVESIDTSTGSVIISGGLGIAKDTHSSGAIHVLNTTQSTTTSQGAIICDGGIGVNGRITTNGLISTNLMISSPTQPQMEIRYGANLGVKLSVDGGGDCTWDCAGNDWFFHNTDAIHVTNTVDSTDTQSGSLRIYGGQGIAKNLYIGGLLYIENGNTSQIRIKNTGSSGPAGFGQIYMDTSSNCVIDSVAGINLKTITAANVTIPNTTDSTNTQSGALVVSGGMGVAKTLTAGTVKYNSKINEFNLLGNTRIAANAPSLSLIGNFYLFNWTPGTSNLVLTTSMDIPHDYLFGTDIIVHTHYFCATTTAGNVRWQIIYDIGIAGGSYNTTGVTLPAVDIPNVASSNGHIYAEIGTIPGSTITVDGAVINITIWRLGAVDSYNGNVYTTSFGCHYQTNRLGS